jgi:hypothetical protein
MRHAILLFASLLFATIINAAPSSAVSIAIASGDGPRVGITLRQPADFLALAITLRSDKSEPVERFAAIASARVFLETEVAKQKGWELDDGMIVLSGRSNSKLASSFGSDAQSELTILVPLSESTDAFAASAAAVRFMTPQVLPAKVEASIGRFSLAVRDPQKYRPQLLKLIAGDAIRTRDTLAPGAQMKFDGLEGPLHMRQMNSREVEFSIDYRLSIEKK